MKGVSRESNLSNLPQMGSRNQRNEQISSFVQQNLDQPAPAPKRKREERAEEPDPSKKVKQELPAHAQQDQAQRAIIASYALAALCKEAAVAPSEEEKPKSPLFLWLRKLDKTIDQGNPVEIRKNF